MSEQQITEQEPSESTTIGERAFLDGYTINGDVVLGAYSAVHNSTINGTIRMDNVTDCIITGCHVYSNDSAGIFMDGGHNDQRNTPIVHDYWPVNAIGDINQGRAELQSQGYMNVAFTLIAPRSILDLLDGNIPNTDVTYRQFLLNNGLVNEIREAEDAQSEVILTVPHNAWIGQKSKFTDEVVEKAWKLLEEYMAPAQYFAFVEGSKIELENKTGEFRLIIDKKGSFSILEGKRGEGIMATSGRIRSYDYPLGDEIATFMDWFKFKTKELISQWNCGTYGIVKEGQRR